MQALIANIGHQMGMSIWIPRSDRERVLREWKNTDAHILDRLPLNYVSDRVYSAWETNYARTREARHPSQGAFP
jgi:hypothetical protein